MAQYYNPTGINIPAPNYRVGEYSKIGESLNNLLNGVRDREIQDAQYARQAAQDARQARLDALNTPGSPEWVAAQKAQQDMKISGLGAEQAWKAANDPVYQNALAAVKRETPGTPEWTEAQKALQNMKLQGLSAELELKKKIDPVYQAQISALGVAESERKGREYLAKEIMGLPTETVVKTEITPEQREAARVGLESAAVVNAGDVYNKEFAKLRGPVTVSKPVLVEGYEVTPGKTAVMSEEEAHQEALKRAGLLDVVAGKAPVIDESRLPKVGVTESTKKLTAEELTQAKLNATIKAAQEGKVPAALALEVATKLNPVKTQKEKLEEAKYALDVEEFKAKKEGGAFKKSDNGTEFSVGEKLYSLAGPSGAAAVKKYLDDNSNKINSLSTSQKKELVAALTAKYGHEDDWLNFTGWDELK